MKNSALWDGLKATNTDTLLVFISDNLTELSEKVQSNEQLAKFFYERIYSENSDLSFAARSVLKFSKAVEFNLSFITTSRKDIQNLLKEYSKVILYLVLFSMVFTACEGKPHGSEIIKDKNIDYDLLETSQKLFRPSYFAKTQKVLDLTDFPRVQLTNFMKEIESLLVWSGSNEFCFNEAGFVDQLDDQSSDDNVVRIYSHKEIEGKKFVVKEVVFNYVSNNKIFQTTVVTETEIDI